MGLLRFGEQVDDATSLLRVPDAKKLPEAALAQLQKEHLAPRRASATRRRTPQFQSSRESRSTIATATSGAGSPSARRSAASVGAETSARSASTAR